MTSFSSDYLVVGGIFGFPSCIARKSLFDSFQAFVNGLHTPKASRSKVGFGFVLIVF
jgi:hypothetical protein